MPPTGKEVGAGGLYDAPAVFTVGAFAVYVGLALLGVGGKLLAVTPIAEPIMLAPGSHFVKFQNPHFQPDGREVRIERCQTVHVEAKLEGRAKAGAGAQP